jgi:hypothetical protein
LERQFRRTARKPSYKQLVARIQQMTGIKPSCLTGPDEDIPGGFGFVFDDDTPKTLVEQGVGPFIAAGERTRKFVEQHQAEILKQGAYLFHTRDLAEDNGPAVAVLPTTDVYQVLAAVETEGANEGVSCEDLQAWLRDLEKFQPFVIVGLGADFVEGKFTSPIRDAPDLVRRINQICQPENSSPDAEEKQIANLLQTQRFFLWWD